jgi:hypothetical protein
MRPLSFTTQTKCSSFQFSYILWLDDPSILNSSEKPILKVDGFSKRTRVNKNLTVAGMSMPSAARKEPQLMARRNERLVISLL